MSSDFRKKHVPLNLSDFRSQEWWEHWGYEWVCRTEREIVLRPLHQCLDATILHSALSASLIMGHVCWWSHSPKFHMIPEKKRSQRWFYLLKKGTFFYGWKKWWNFGFAIVTAWCWAQGWFVVIAEAIFFFWEINGWCHREMDLV